MVVNWEGRRCRGSVRIRRECHAYPTLYVFVEAAFVWADGEGLVGAGRTCAVWTFLNASCVPYELAGYGVPPALALRGEARGGSCGRDRAGWGV